MLVPLQRAGLDAINISLDTLKRDKYEQIARRKGWERVIAGIDLAIQLGYKPKVNCVLMKNFNDNEICDFVEFTRDRDVDVRFIEYMPFSGNKWHTDKLVSFKSAFDTIKEKYPDFQALPNGPNDTSKAFGVPNFKGQIGFITSMTEHFCGSCNRLRLTADGNLKVCLFGNTEISLRDAIRAKSSDDDMEALISAAVKRKKKQHAGKFHQAFISLMSLLLHYTFWPRHVESIPNGKSPDDSDWRLKISFFSLSFIPKVSLPPSIISFTPSLPLRLEKPWNYQIPITSLPHAFLKSSSYQSSFARFYTTSNHLTHIDLEGKAKMVDVTAKAPSDRMALATASVYVGPKISKLINDNSMKKGDVLSIAQLAGIVAAKKTSDLIPLCHNIPLSSVGIQCKLDLKNHSVEIISQVKCSGKTGVEMEALTGVAVAALTVYDMCKAVSHSIVVKNIRLLEKTGGKNDFMNGDGPFEGRKVASKLLPDASADEIFHPIHI